MIALKSSLLLFMAAVVIVINRHGLRIEKGIVETNLVRKISYVISHCFNFKSH